MTKSYIKYNKQLIALILFLCLTLYIFGVSGQEETTTTIETTTTTIESTTTTIENATTTTIPITTTTIENVTTTIPNETTTTTTIENVTTTTIENVTTTTTSTTTIPTTTTVPPNWSIQDNTVYVNDSRIFILATPHTIYSSQWVYFNLTSKVFAGDADIVWGFDTTVAKPTKAEYYNPHTVYWNTSNSRYFYNVTKNTSTSANCEVGFSYNTFKRNVTYTNPIYNETTNTTIWVTSNIIACFDSYTRYGNDVEIYWHEEHSRIEDYTDITDLFDSFDKDYKGMNKWYYLKQVNINANQSYMIRAYVDVPVTLDNLGGKYFMCIKRSIDTIEDAITNDRYYCLDPWWNSSWSYRKKLYVNQTGTTNIINIPILVNGTKGFDTQALILTGKLDSQGKCLRFVNSTNNVLSYDWDSYSSATNGINTINTLVWLKVPNLPPSGTTVYMYYDNKACSWGNSSTDTWSDYSAVLEFSESAGTGTTYSKIHSDVVNCSQYTGSPVTETGGKFDNGYYVPMSSRANCDDSIYIRAPRLISVWANITNTQQYGSIIERWGAGYSTSSYVLHQAGNNNIFSCVLVNSSHTSQETVSTSFTMMNTMHHYTCYDNGTHLNTYIDGVLNASQPLIWSSGNDDYSDNAYLGSSTIWGNRFMESHIDDMRFSSNIFSDDYILRTYRQDLSYFESPAIEEVYSGWWDTDWRARKLITITNPDAYTVNFQVPLNISYSPLMKPDFSDLRFIDLTEYSYFIADKVNSEWAYVWLNIPSFNIGSNTVYMYYGNPAVTTTGSFSNTFPNGIEYFNSSNTLGSAPLDWTHSTGTCPASIVNSYYTSSPYGFKMNGTNDYYTKNINPVTGGVDIEYNFYLDNSPYRETGFFLFQSGTRLFETYVLNNGSFASQGTGELQACSVTLSQNAWHHVRLAVDFNNSRVDAVYIDGTLCTGQIGFENTRYYADNIKIIKACSGTCDCSAVWDDFFVRGYQNISSEPTYSVGSEQQVWADTAYPYRRPILSSTIQYPVAINDSKGVNGNIIWALIDNSSYLYSKYYKSGGGLKVGTNTTETYWENESSRTGYNPTLVWDSNYKAVWHFSNTSMLDSSQNNVQVVGTQGSPTQVTGLFGNALNFDGNDGYNVTQIYSGNDSFTIEVWVKTEELSGGDGEYVIFAHSANARQLFIYVDSTNLWLSVADSDGVSHSISMSRSLIVNGQWQYISAVRNSTGLYLYHNATYMGSTTIGTTSFQTNYIGTEIGMRWKFATSQWCCFWNGSIDEVRLSNQPRDETYIKNQYYNGINNLTSLGSDEFFSWTNTSYPYRWQIKSTSTSEIPTSLNDTNTVGGNTIWALVDGNTHLYSTSSSGFSDIKIYDYLTGLPKYWENESSLSGYSPTSIWNNSYLIFHLGDTSGSTTIGDSSGNGNNATTVSGDVTLGVSGVFGKAIDFAGTDDYIQTAGKNNPNIPFSVEFWVKFDAINAWNYIALTLDNNNNLGDWVAVVANTGKFRWYRNAPLGVGTYVEASDVVQTGQWYHFVGVYNGTISLYINGTQYTANASGAPSFSQTGGVRIGAWYDSPPANGINGQIDEFRIWNKSLTSAEIQSHFQNGLSTSLAPLGEMETYQVKSTSSCTLTSSAGWAYGYSNSTTLTCGCTGDGTIHLYFNNIQHDEYNNTPMTFGASTYPVICNSTETSNYFSGTTNNTLTVNQAPRTCTLATDKLWIRTYDGTASSTTCSVSVGSSDGSMIFTVNSTPVSTPDLRAIASAYAYACQWTGGINYSDCTQQTNTLIINQATSTVSLTVIPPSPITYETQSNATCTDTNPEANQILYRNGIDVTSTENNIYVYLPAGAWNYTCYVPATQNYTSASTSQTYIVNPENANVTVVPPPPSNNASLVVTLNDSSTSKNVSFTGNQNTTVYLNIPKNVTVLSAYLNLSGYNNTVDFEIDDNTGDYLSSTGSFFETNPASNADDGTSNNAACLNGNTCTITMRWNKPTNVNISSRIDIGAPALANNCIWESRSYNNLTQACLDYNPTYVEFLVTLSNDGSGGCTSGDSVKLECRKSGGYDTIFYDSDYAFWFNELDMYWYGQNSSYPINPYLDVTNDGDIEWSYTGEFNHTNNRTSDFSSKINQYLISCTSTSGNCSIPLVLHSDTLGIIQISDINVNFQYNIYYPTWIVQYCTDQSVLLDCWLYRNGVLIPNGTASYLPPGNYTWLATLPGQYINSLNDSSIIKNLTFAGGENQTVWIQLNKSLSIENAQLNLNGYKLPPNIEVNAEDTYLCNGVWSTTGGYNCPVTVDENWDTYSYPAAWFTQVSLEEWYNTTYNLTANITFKGGNGNCPNIGAYWLTLNCFNHTSQAWVSVGSGNDVDNEIINFTLPRECYWNGTSQKLWTNITLPSCNGYPRLYESMLVWVEQSNITNPYLDVSNDGDTQFSCNGVFGNCSYYQEFDDGHSFGYPTSYLCYDGNWGTGSYSTYVGGSAYVNYTLQPSANRSATTWDVKYSMDDYDSCDDPADVYINNFTIPEQCWIDPIQIRIQWWTSGSNSDGYYFWCRNLTGSEIELGHLIGGCGPGSQGFIPTYYEDAMKWKFDTTPIRTTDFSSELNSYLLTCTPNANLACDVPLVLHSDSIGMLQISDINITTANYYNYQAQSTLNISKGPAVLFIDTTPSSPITYETQSNATCWGVSLETTPILYRNGSALSSLTEVTYLPASVWNYTCVVADTENYTGTSVTVMYTVNKKDANVQVYPSTQSQSYPYTVTQYCTEDTWLSSCSLYRNETSISNSTDYTPIAGVYIYKANISDTSNYTNYQDTETLTITKNVSQVSLSVTPLTPITYQTQSNATCTDTNPESSAVLYRNGTDVTSTENGLLVYLPAGAWNYTCYVAETQNYTSASTEQTYIVNKFNANVQVYPVTQSQTYPYTTSQYCTQDTTWFSCSIYRNDSLISNNTQYSPAVGVYTYKANITDTSNYSNYQDTETLTINRNTSSTSLSIVPSTPIVYETQSNVSCTDSNPEASQILYRNETDVTITENNIYLLLPAGGWNYTCYVPQTENYTSASTSQIYVVSKYNASVQVYPTTQTVTYPTWLLQYCTDISVLLDCHIYRNGVEIGNYTNELLPSGIYTYVANLTDTANYTDWQTSSTVNISKNVSSVTLTITPTTPITYSTQSNATCTDTNLEASALIYRNNTLVSNPEVTELPAGTWNYTCVVAETQNYTSASTTQWYTVDKKAPSFTSSVTTPIIYETLSDYIASESNSIDLDCIYILLRNGTQIMNGSSVSDNTRLGNGTYNYTYYTVGCTNFTAGSNYKSLQVLKKNATVLVYPVTQSIIYGTSVLQYCTDNSTLIDCAIYRNETSVSNGTTVMLGGGVYTYKANLSDSYNYSGYEKYETLTVGKATHPDIHLAFNNSETNAYVFYGWLTNTTGWSIINNQTDLTYYLYQNNVQITTGNPATQLTNVSVGTYTYTYNVSAGQNYTSNSISRTLSVAGLNISSIRDVSTGSLITANLTIYNSTTSRVINNVDHFSDYSSTLPSGTNVQIKVEKSGYGAQLFAVNMNVPNLMDISLAQESITTFYQTFIVVQTTLFGDQPIASASVKLYKWSGGIRTLFAEGTTNAAGSTTVFVSMYIYYDISVNATGFQGIYLTDQMLTPGANPLYIHMSTAVEEVPTYEAPQSGQTVEIRPTSTYIPNQTQTQTLVQQNGTNYTWPYVSFGNWTSNVPQVTSCNVSTINGTITYVKYMVIRDYNNGTQTTLYTNITYGVPNGTIIYRNISDVGTYILSCGYYTNNTKLFMVNRTIIIYNPTSGGLLQVTGNIGQMFSPFTIQLIALIITMIVTAFFARWFGIATGFFPLIVYGMVLLVMGGPFYVWGIYGLAWLIWMALIL